MKAPSYSIITPTKTGDWFYLSFQYYSLSWNPLSPVTQFFYSPARLPSLTFYGPSSPISVRFCDTHISSLLSKTVSQIFISDQVAFHFWSFEMMLRGKRWYSPKLFLEKRSMNKSLLCPISPHVINSAEALVLSLFCPSMLTAHAIPFVWRSIRHLMAYMAL